MDGYRIEIPPSCPPSSLRSLSWSKSTRRVPWYLDRWACSSVTYWRDGGTSMSGTNAAAPIIDRSRTAFEKHPSCAMLIRLVSNVNHGVNTEYDCNVLHFPVIRHRFPVRRRYDAFEASPRRRPLALNPQTRSSYRHSEGKGEHDNFDILPSTND